MSTSSRYADNQRQERSSNLILLLDLDSVWALTLAQKARITRFNPDVGKDLSIKLKTTVIFFF